MSRTTRHYLLFSALSLMTSIVYADAPEKITLIQLYQGYLEQDRSTLEMPQYKKEVLLSGVVLGFTENFSGEPMMQAGDADYEDVLATLRAKDSAEAKKMSTLQPGANFKAICILDSALNSKTLPLNNCVFKQ